MASVGATFVVLRSWERYVANPTVVSLEKDYRQWSTLFPAVTICFLENLNYTRAKHEIQKYDSSRCSVLQQREDHNWRLISENQFGLAIFFREKDTF
jgi:hypothetical protein